MRRNKAFVYNILVIFYSSHSLSLRVSVHLHILLSVLSRCFLYNRFQFRRTRLQELGIPSTARKIVGISTMPVLSSNPFPYLILDLNFARDKLAF
jgi:hypothetical protein